MLEEHEEAIASLYAVFSSCLPETKDFWAGLVLEEKCHASWLRTLRERLESDGSLLNRRQFNTAAIQTSIDYVKRRINEVSSQGITTLRALVIGLDLEAALLEKDFFRILESDSTEMKKQFNALIDQTASHRKMLEAQLAVERAKKG